MTDFTDLNDIRIVLVGTTHPGNIGAAARAMKNMGLRRLCLVAPERFPHADATSRASGADDLLARAEVYGSLDEALAGCSLVLGASARHRRTIPLPEVDARGAGAAAMEAATAGRETAFVFGREHSGLTNAELDRCQRLLHIPTNPEYSSLNLAAAVQVVAYEVRMAALAGASAMSSSREMDPPATADELEGLYGHLERLMIRIGFLDPDNPKHLMRRLRRLFNRAALERTEVNILRGVLTETEKHLR